ncbi:Imm3 family immunity protein [Clostridium uliginosum]|uniref:Immunity protein Imm3 n=1 Tax=Clostridium uliginosum TaxID=119641 RepID=A0A1I1STT4_9CLOT|nr:Imm3 family immunity protein [Clostridium uliginosum]SFD49731.1 Immunity protein Imm3 [Clostridium uliginosum]
MKEWEFDELYEYIEEVFNKSLNDGLNELQAGGRCLYEFANVIEDGETEKQIVYTTIATLEIKYGVLSQRIFEEVSRIIDTFRETNIREELDLDLGEIDKFTNIINNLRVNMDAVKIQ